MYIYDDARNTTSTDRPFEYLRLTSLGVIGALVKVDDQSLGPKDIWSEKGDGDFGDFWRIKVNPSMLIHCGYGYVTLLSLKI